MVPWFIAIKYKVIDRAIWVHDILMTFQQGAASACARMQFVCTAAMTTYVCICCKHRVYSRMQ